MQFHWLLWANFEADRNFPPGKVSRASWWAGEAQAIFSAIRPELRLQLLLVATTHTDSLLGA